MKYIKIKKINMQVFFSAILLLAKKYFICMHFIYKKISHTAGEMKMK
jgi:hypothetical protein